MNNSWDCKQHKRNFDAPTYKGKTECPLCVQSAQDRLKQYMEKRR